MEYDSFLKNIRNRLANASSGEINNFATISETEYSNIESSISQLDSLSGVWNDDVQKKAGELVLNIKQGFEDCKKFITDTALPVASKLDIFINALDDYMKTVEDYNAIVEEYNNITVGKEPTSTDYPEPYALKMAHDSWSRKKKDKESKKRDVLAYFMDASNARNDCYDYFNEINVLLGSEVTIVVPPIKMQELKEETLEDEKWEAIPLPDDSLDPEETIPGTRPAIDYENDPKYKGSKNNDPEETIPGTRPAIDYENDPKYKGSKNNDPEETIPGTRPAIDYENDPKYKGSKNNDPEETISSTRPAIDYENDPKYKGSKNNDPEETIPGTRPAIDYENDPKYKGSNNKSEDDTDSAVQGATDLEKQNEGENNAVVVPKEGYHVVENDDLKEINGKKIYDKDGKEYTAYVARDGIYLYDGKGDTNVAPISKDDFINKKEYTIQDEILPVSELPPVEDSNTQTPTEPSNPVPKKGSGLPSIDYERDTKYINQTGTPVTIDDIKYMKEGGIKILYDKSGERCEVKRIGDSYRVEDSDGNVYIATKNDILANGEYYNGMPKNTESTPNSNTQIPSETSNPIPKKGSGLPSIDYERDTKYINQTGTPVTIDDIKYMKEGGIKILYDKSGERCEVKRIGDSYRVEDSDGNVYIATKNDILSDGEFYNGKPKSTESSATSASNPEKTSNNQNPAPTVSKEQLRSIESTDLNDLNGKVIYGNNGEKYTAYIDGTNVNVYEEGNNMPVETLTPLDLVMKGDYSLMKDQSPSSVENQIAQEQPVIPANIEQTQEHPSIPANVEKVQEQPVIPVSTEKAQVPEIPVKQDSETLIKNMNRMRNGEIIEATNENGEKYYIERDGTTYKVTDSNNNIVAPDNNPIECVEDFNLINSKKLSRNEELDLYFKTMDGMPLTKEGQKERMLIHIKNYYNVSDWECEGIYRDWNKTK